MKRCFTGLAGLLLIASTGSVEAGGVTLITHGFNSDVASWIIPMQSSVAKYGALSLTNTACYDIEITAGSGGQYNTTVNFLSGTNPLAAASGEILIKLNWSTLSGLGGVSTLVIATNAANALLNANLIPALGGRALAELPLHLAGHSRGASVVAEMTRLLGAQGVWVDHVTGLDPVPVSGFGDPAMKLYANIFFADNYWQNLNATLLDPQGQSLPGAYNRKLTNLSGAATSAHSDVHLWYHGTIDFTNSLKVDGATLSPTERTNWYTSFEQRGTNAGFRLSLIGGGDRTSTNEPAGAGNGRINDGVNRNFDFGFGVSPNRSALPVNSGGWPNPLLLTHTATNPLPASVVFDFTCQYQAGTNTATNVTFQVLLDADANPWNGNETLLYQELIASTGANAVATLTRTAAASVAPGTYHLLSKLSLGGRSRYLYAPSPVMLTPGVTPPVLTTLGFTNGYFRLRITGTTGQSIVTEGSTNLTQWVAVATNLLSEDSIEFIDPQSAETPFRFYRAVTQP